MDGTEIKGLITTFIQVPFFWKNDWRQFIWISVQYMQVQDIQTESVNIYKSDNYSEDNPVYILKGLDANGNAFEQEVDASKINPNSCSYNELMVLNVETGHTSPSDYLHSVATRDKSGTDSFFETSNYIEYAKEVMNDMKTVGDYASYLSYDKWIQSILSYGSKFEK